jgi:hypothetical protein
MQNVHMNKMINTKNRYIPLNIGQVGHFQTPKIHGNPSGHGGTLDGSQHFRNIIKYSTMLVTGVYLILFTIANRHLSLGVVTERNFAMGKSVNDIHLCKNLRLGL